MHSIAQAVSIKVENVSCEYDRLKAETELCKLRGTIDLCFIYEYGVCEIFLVLNTWLHNLYGRSFARVQQFGNCHAGRILVAQCMRLALSLCVLLKCRRILVFSFHG